MTTIDTSPIDQQPRAEAPHEPPRRSRFFRLDNVSLLFIWAALVVVFGILVPETFLTTDTFRTILAGQAITAIMALALLMPIAAAQFDLSVAGAMGIGIVLVATFMSKMGMNPWTAVALTLGAGVCVGLVNAFVVVNLKVNSFIATLGTGSVLSALIQWITDGQQIVTGIPEGFVNVGRHEIFTIPASVFIMLGIAALMWYVLEYRQTGRYLYAIGSNTEAARLAGVKVNRLTRIALVCSALIGTIAGVVFVMRIGSASLDAGQPYLLPAFAAAFLGATQFKSGNVNVLGTLVAVYVLATGVKGVQLLGAPFWVDGLFNGLALIIAVALAVRSGQQKSLG